MKRRRKIAALLTACALAAGLAACGGKAEGQSAPAPESEAPVAAEKTAEPEPPATEPEQDPAVYAPVLNGAYALLYNGYDDEADSTYASAGLMELTFGRERAERLSAAGYVLRDLNGDGRDELLIGAMDGTALYDGYACRDGAPVRFLEGWARSSYAYLGGDRFFYAGSGGAMDSAFGVFRLSADGGELVCEDFWFTTEKDGKPGEIAKYHNKTGAWDASVSEETDLTDEAFWALWEGYGSECKALDLTPLRDYAYTGAEPLREDCAVRADYLSAVAASLGEREDAAALFPALYPEGQAFETTVVFRADGGARDFTLLSLTLRDVDESGRADFAAEPLFTIAELRPGVALTVPMSFPGDIPNNGFSYTGADGVTRQFTLSMSGMDGSLVIAPF